MYIFREFLYTNLYYSLFETAVEVIILGLDWATALVENIFFTPGNINSDQKGIMVPVNI